MRRRHFASPSFSQAEAIFAEFSNLYLLRHWPNWLIHASVYPLIQCYGVISGDGSRSSQTLNRFSITANQKPVVIVSVCFCTVSPRGSAGRYITLGSPSVALPWSIFKQSRPYLELMDPLYELCYGDGIDLLHCTGTQEFCSAVARMMLYSALMWPDSQQNLANLLARARLFVSHAGEGTRRCNQPIFESGVHWIQISLWRFEARNHLRLVKKTKNGERGESSDKLFTTQINHWRLQYRFTLSKKVLIFYLCN